MAETWQDISKPYQGPVAAPVAPAPAAAAPPPDWKDISTPHDPNAYRPGFIAGYRVPGLETLQNLTNVAGDAGTFGLADTAMGGLDKATGVGPSSDQLRATTQASRDAVGPVASGAADIAGYAAGGGAIGVGNSLAGLMGRSIGARVAAGAAEGAGSAALGTAGHGDVNPKDLAENAAIGGAVGGTTGLLPGMRTVPGNPTTAELQARVAAPYADASNAALNPNDVGTALKQAYGSLTFGEKKLMASGTDKLATDTIGELTGRNKPNFLSADDVSKLQQAFMDSATTSKQMRIAGLFNDALEGVYGSAKPIIANARATANKALTSGEIDQWLANPSSAPGQVAGALAKDPGFYTGVAPALQPVADMASPSILQQMKQKIVGRGASALGHAALGMAIGGDPITGALYGAARRPITGAVTSAIRAAPVTKNLLAAQYLNATGRQLPASAFAPTNPMGQALADLVKKGGYTGGAVENLPYSN